MFCPQDMINAYLARDTKRWEKKEKNGKYIKQKQQQKTKQQTKQQHKIKSKNMEKK